MPDLDLSRPLWHCPACDKGTMHPLAGEAEAPGPFKTACNHCSFEATQTLDAPMNPRDHRP